jgi:hypothetical protein
MDAPLRHGLRHRLWIAIRNPASRQSASSQLTNPMAVHTSSFFSACFTVPVRSSHPKITPLLNNYF